MLRENRGGASRADFILITKSPFPIPASAQKLKAEISAYSNAPAVFTYMRYREPVPMNSNRPAISFDNLKNVFLLTGIARPEPLLHFLQSQEIKVEHLRFADHHAFSGKDLDLLTTKFNHFLSLNSGAIILTTRKDAMRLMEKNLAETVRKLPVYVIDIEARLAEENDDFVNRILHYAASHS
jgi:tetraacyldisaccharide 4'-kinase